MEKEVSGQYIYLTLFAQHQDSFESLQFLTQNSKNLFSHAQYNKDAYMYINYAVTVKLSTITILNKLTVI